MASPMTTVVFTARPPWGQSPVRPCRNGTARRARRGRARNRFVGSGRMAPVSAPSPTGPFAALSPQVDLPALEQEILQRWEADKVFARSMENTADRPQWVFYEG